MNNPHELKGYYESLIKNYKKLSKYIDNCKTSDVSTGEQDNMKRKLQLIKDKIDDFNRLYGAYIRKRRDSFGKFNIEAFINHLYGNAPKGKQCKLEKIYNNVETNLCIDLSSEKKLSSSSPLDVGNQIRNGNFYNPGNFFGDRENQYPDNKMGYDNKICGKREDNKRGSKDLLIDPMNPYMGVYCYPTDYEDYFQMRELAMDAGNFNENIQNKNYQNPYNGLKNEYQNSTDYNSKRDSATKNNSGKSIESNVTKKDEYLDPKMFQFNEDSNKKNTPEMKYYASQYKNSHKQGGYEENFTGLNNGTVFRNFNEKEESNNETVHKFETILGDIKLSLKTKAYIKEMCDVIIENICNSSCLIAKNANKDFLDEEDIKLAFRMEYNVDFPDVVKKYKMTENDVEHEKKLNLIDKEKKRKTKIH